MSSDQVAAPVRPAPLKSNCTLLGYAWDGARCQGLANCHCYERCEEVFPTRESCEAAYAVCLDGGR